MTGCPEGAAVCDPYATTWPDAVAFAVLFICVAAVLIVWIRSRRR